MGLNLASGEFVLKGRCITPQFRQGSVGQKRIGGITPVTGARAGTVNDAGGLVINIDARNYKSLKLAVIAGVVGTSVDCKLQDSATSGGSYADLTGGAITQIVAGPAEVELDAKITPGRPWLSIVMVTVGSTTAAGAELYGVGPMSTSRT